MDTSEFPRPLFIPKGGKLMGVQQLTHYFTQYGPAIIFLIVLLEYMNLPGFPAGVIMPVAGIWAARGNISFLTVMVLSVAAGVLGSWILYFIGRFGGERFVRFYTRKFPKQKEALEKNLEMIRKKGAYGVFFSKLVPMLRTLISIPAGIVGLDFARYTVSSLLGVCLWNLAFVGAGCMRTLEGKHGCCSLGIIRFVFEIESPMSETHQIS